MPSYGGLPTQPVELDLPMVRGDTFGPQALILRTVDNDPVDLTGLSVEIIYDLEGRGVVKRTTDATLVLEDPTTGTVPLFLTAEETKRMPVGKRGRWRLRTLSNDPLEDEEIKTVFVGRLIVEEYDYCGQ